MTDKKKLQLLGFIADKTVNLPFTRTDDTTPYSNQDLGVEWDGHSNDFKVNNRTHEGFDTLLSEEPKVKQKLANRYGSLAFAITLALISATSLTAPTPAEALGNKIPWYIPTITNAAQAAKAHARSVTYQILLSKKIRQITDWQSLREAVKYTPWCRATTTKHLKNGHDEIWHYDSHGVVRGKYALHNKIRLVKRKDRLFLRSKSKMTLCGGAYDVSVLKNTLVFKREKGVTMLRWTF